MMEAVLTLIFMLMFIALCVWVYRPKAKAKYQALARIPFEDAKP